MFFYEHYGLATLSILDTLYGGKLQLTNPAYLGSSYIETIAFLSVSNNSHIYFKEIEFTRTK